MSIRGQDQGTTSIYDQRTRVRVLDHQLARSLESLTFGVVRKAAEREENRRTNALQEIERQFQIPMSGDADGNVTTDSTRLDFDAPFVYAPGNRDSDFDVPQVKFASVVEGTVLVSGHVTAWVRDENRGVVTGATVAVAVSAPGAESSVPYVGVAHFTFQGYAAIDEDESEG